MTTTIELDQCPGPHGLPLVGNAFDIDAHNPIEGFIAMAADYGPIFKVTVPGSTRLMVSGPELVEEICDDSRFDKSVVGAGLFTADTEAPLSPRAPNPLMAPFSVPAMRDYMPRMLDIADQLMEK